MSAQLFSRTSRESAHLALLGALAVIVPAIWLLLLHWSPGKLIDQGDNLASGYIYLKQLMESDGQWQQLLFWPQPLGGVKAHDVAGSLPVVQLMIKLGAGFITISNVSILSLQVMFGYFCARAVAGLSLQGFQQRTLPLATLVAIGVMFAFLPALGWRVTEGHQTIIQGLFVFVCMAVLILDESNEQRSALTVLLSLIVLSHTFQYNGFQTMYYSVVLGAPMILAILMVPPDQTLRQRALLTLFPVAVFGCAILFSLPKLWGVIGNAFSDDSGRVYGSSVIYSYTTATAADWITSLPWSPDLIPEDRLPYKFEVNYPMGTFLLLLALAGINRTTLSLAAGILVSLFMALVISTNFEPFSTLLVSSLPMMESFRVPARAMLPVLVFLSIVAITVLVNLDRQADASRWSLKAILSFILIALVTSQLPTLIVDLVLLLALAGLVFARESVAKRPDIVRYLFAFIVGAAVGAFETRIHPPLEHPLAGIAETRQELLGQAPDLEKPLVRAHTLISLPHVGPNTMFSMGIGSLTGYWFPPSRYLQLYAAANEVPFSATTNVFFSQARAPGFQLLNRLYNVQYQVSVEQQQLRASLMPDETLGEAWFSQKVAWHADYATLVSAMKAADITTLRQTAHLVSEDPATGSVNSASLDCSNARADVQHQAVRPFPLFIDTRVDGDCLLTVSVNYSSIFSVQNEKGEKLQTLPGYGALLSIQVPEGTRQVVVTPMVSGFPGIEGSYLLAVLLSLFLLYRSVNQPFANGGTEPPHN